MNILISYFSATGNTEFIARAMAARFEELGDKVELRSVTTPQSRKANPDFSEYDAVVFGSPVHIMRAPLIFRDWLAQLDGQGRRCAMFFSYGGFQTHPCHLNTAEILQSRGFQVVGSAEFTGEHTFNMVGWQALADRPGDEETSAARLYADQIRPRLAGVDPAVPDPFEPGHHTIEELDMMEQGQMQFLGNKAPSRSSSECQMCMLCEQLCPTGAMDAEKGVADKDKCMICLRCLKICSDQVLKFTDMSAVFQHKMERDGETPESLAAKTNSMFL